MKKIAYIALFLHSMTAYCQQDAEGVKVRMQEFHTALVENKNVPAFLDDSLSYGHSNGWIESGSDMMKNLGRRLIYHSFREDSIRIGVNKDLAHIRFVADIDVTLDGRRTMDHLRILEVWVKKNKTWKLFARQAVR